MAHQRQHHYSRPEDLRARFLVNDARVLMHRYALRNNPERRLSAGQRQAWAHEVISTLQAMCLELENRMGSEHARFDFEIRQNLWEQAYRAGRRIAKPLKSDGDMIREMDRARGGALGDPL